MNRIKELREEKNLLQKDIADVIGVTPQAIGMYERGDRDLSTSTVIQLSQFFGVSSDYLLGKSDDKSFSEIASSENSNNCKLNIDGLDDDDIEELQKLIDYIKRLKK